MDNVSLFFTVFNLSHKFPILDSLMVFGANYLIYMTFILAAALVLIGKAQEKKALLLLIFSIPLALATIKLVHIFYFEPRPYLTFQLIPLIPHSPDAAFPSEHTAMMATVFFSYLFNKSKFWPVFLFFLLWVGFARVFVGVHYPLDILGGIVTGFAAVSIVWLIKNLVLGKAFPAKHGQCSCQNKDCHSHHECCNHSET